MSDISITINDEKDLYNQFDPSVVNDRLISFIADRFNELDHNLALTVVTNSPIDIARLKAAFSAYGENRQKKLKTERKLNLVRQLRLFLIGLAFITIWLVISAKLNGIWPEVLSIIGSFAIWEAASIWLVDNPNIRLRKHLLKLLSEIEIKMDLRADPK